MTDGNNEMMYVTTIPPRLPPLPKLKTRKSPIFMPINTISTPTVLHCSELLFSTYSADLAPPSRLGLTTTFPSCVATALPHPLLPNSVHTRDLPIHQPNRHLPTTWKIMRTPTFLKTHP